MEKTAVIKYKCVYYYTGPMLYNFTHAHICDLWLQVHMEEKLANLPKLIGRPLKMIGLEGAVAGGKKKKEKRSPKATQKRWGQGLLCQRQPLFIYFDKQSFTLIIHDNACPGRSQPPMSEQPHSGLWFSM